MATATRTITAMQLMAIMNSYMLPHGTRCSDSPRVRMPVTCVARPTQVSANAVRIQRPGRSGSGNGPAAKGEVTRVGEHRERVDDDRGQQEAVADVGQSRVDRHWNLTPPLRREGLDREGTPRDGLDREGLDRRCLLREWMDRGCRNPPAGRPERSGGHPAPR